MLGGSVGDISFPPEGVVGGVQERRFCLDLGGGAATGDGGRRLHSRTDPRRSSRWIMGHGSGKIEDRGRKRPVVGEKQRMRGYARSPF